MSMNYIENHKGTRRIKWIGLVSFLLLCLLVVPVVAYIMISLIAPGAQTARNLALLIGFITAVFIFVSSCARSLRMPIDQLPKSNNV